MNKKQLIIRLEDRTESVMEIAESVDMSITLPPDPTPEQLLEAFYAFTSLLRVVKK